MVIPIWKGSAPSALRAVLRPSVSASHEFCHSGAFTMNGLKRRIQRCWHGEGAGGFSLVMTFHDSGQGPVYRIEADDGTQLAWTGTELDAKARADDRLREEGHQCSSRCTAWSPIPQPEPLSENQKKTVSACFRELQQAVETGAFPRDALTALRREYQGPAEALIDAFDAAANPRQALHDIEKALKDDSEGHYWQD